MSEHAEALSNGKVALAYREAFVDMDGGAHHEKKLLPPERAAELGLDLLAAAAEAEDDADLDAMRPAERLAFILLHGTDAASTQFVEGEDAYRVVLDVPFDDETDAAEVDA